MIFQRRCNQARTLITSSARCVLILGCTELNKGVCEEYSVLRTIFFLFSDGVLRGDIYAKPPTTLTYFTSVSSDYPVAHRLSSLQHQLHISTTPFDQTTSTGPWSNLIIPYHSHPTPEVKTEEDSIVSRTEDEERNDAGVKKKNPYSIEELLKKPESNKKSRRVQIEFSDVRQPIGVMVESEGDEGCSLLEVEKTDEL